MKLKDIYIKNIQEGSFRPNVVATIIQVKLFIPEKGCGLPRPCFLIKYPDGVLDTIPIFSDETFQIKNPAYEFVLK